MRVRRYWIGYDADDVNRAEQALRAHSAYLDRLLLLEQERLNREFERSQARIEALIQERDRLLDKERLLLEAGDGNHDEAS